MADAPQETEVVEHEVRVAARPETVFSYFTDPARMVQWMGAEATLDPRPGGVCRIVFHPIPAIAVLDAAFGTAHHDAVARIGPGGPRVMMGEFVEVDPHRRIVFTWGWEQELYSVPPQSTEVEVSLTPDGDGAIVRLAHRRLPPRSVAFHRAGWEHYLVRLGTVAEGHDPGPDVFVDPEAFRRALDAVRARGD
jgi:uncharacterized protein YndB with AHSA1/START domain